MWEDVWCYFVIVNAYKELEQTEKLSIEIHFFPAAYIHCVVRCICEK